MYCTHCGEKIPEKSKFCPSCGGSISPNESAPKEIKSMPSTEGKSPTPPVSKDSSQRVESGRSPSRAVIKCGNCGFVGEGKPARRLVFKILAWSVVLFAPLITLIYFVATPKYRCPKCQSSFLGIKNKQGIFEGQKSGSSRWPLIVIAIFVFIAIIGILASIVLASLNSARRKSRDARRVADVKQIQLVLELYHDSNSSYPAGLTELVPVYLPKLPNDPLDNISYSYFRCAPNLYHIGTSLEESSNPALNADEDLASLCNGDFINGLDTNKCFFTHPGSYCYDVTSVASDGDSTGLSIYYTNATANVRSCASSYCEVVVQYPKNTPFRLPYSTFEMPEWVPIEWGDTEGNTGMGYMHRTLFSITPQ